MINQRNILGVIFIIAIAFYKLFSVDESYAWSSVYFLTQNCLLIYTSRLILKSYRDRLLQIIFKVIMGVTIVELLFNIYSFVDIEGFNKINGFYESGAILVSCIVVFLIYKRYGRMVKK